VPGWKTLFFFLQIALSSCPHLSKFKLNFSQSPQALPDLLGGSHPGGDKGEMGTRKEKDLSNKIRDKGRTDSAWKPGVEGGEKRWVGGEGWGVGGAMTQTMYAHVNK
jgi:hypothetical protein